MPQRSEEAAAFFAAVYAAITEIPYGKVTSYGHIARLVGKRMKFHSSVGLLRN
jgi:methylated-DNA-protein-cysteine methyltransferase-like protein